MKPVCCSCEAASAAPCAAPHTRMELQRAHREPEGVFEHYRCLDCGTRRAWLFDEVARGMVSVREDESPFELTAG